jgi:hypothetical protein
MDSSSPERLRMTVSPLRPDAWPRRAYRMEERAGLPFIGGPGIAAAEGGHDTNPLPLELLPELDRLDMRSEEAILGFARSYGVLGAWRDRFNLMRTPDFAVRTVVRRVIRARERTALRGNDPNGEFVGEFRVAADGLRSLLMIVRELERPAFAASRLTRDWPAYSPWPPPDSESRAWWALYERINQGLRTAPMALWWVRDDEPTDGWSYDFVPGPPFVLHPATPTNLYGVCILELAGHLTAGNPYRVCANETCGRLFSVQEGRSKYGAHRTDNLRFHHKNCKEAQTQREYRRREAAKRRKGKVR